MFVFFPKFQYSLVIYFIKNIKKIKYFKNKNKFLNSIIM
ncbi:hypothetical protein SRH_00320 [Mesomycoplasma hyorhinis MCLD]|uniref:Uncharacterized protein n=1 Tax=Mesomycoplasma hyorhinis (strain MCLD) TaxID=936139 RepID=A0ABM5M5E3_MESHM|nr:hypothetical protein SRH_00320 [Mesomycoplasma hyorhinis MCLD]